jgi:hypothetical protein
MKTAQQIQLELSRCAGDIELQNCIREIQDDALNHAASVCQRHANTFKKSQDGFGGGWTVLASEECRDLILADRAAMPNEKS